MQLVAVLPEDSRESGGGPAPELEINSAVAKAVFRLNGQLMGMAEDLAAPAGLTAAG